MTENGKRRRRGGGAARCTGLVGATALAAILAGGEAARAACDPAAGNNVTATCTGTTIDQNNPNGYGTAGLTNLNVTVVPGASVTGTNNGLTFATGTVTNSGARRLVFLWRERAA